MRRYRTSEGEAFSEDCTTAFTSTVVLGLVTPPGPVAVSSYAVVCRGEMILSPVVGTGLMPLMSASMVSPEVQANRVFWLQSILAGLTETAPATRATTTVALAMPACNRATPALSLLDPRD